jgi:hypothetical protein
LGLLYTAGGIPFNLNKTTAVNVLEKWTWNPNQGGGVSNWLWFKNTGANPMTLSFTQADADAGIGVTLAAGAVFEGPAQLGAFLTKSTLGTTFESVLFLRRG